MLGSMSLISPPVVTNEPSFSPQLHAASAKQQAHSCSSQPPTPRLQLGAGTTASHSHSRARVTLQDTIVTATSLAPPLFNRARQTEKWFDLSHTHQAQSPCPTLAFAVAGQGLCAFCTPMMWPVTADAPPPPTRRVCARGEQHK